MSNRNNNIKNTSDNEENEKNTSDNENENDFEYEISIYASDKPNFNQIQEIKLGNFSDKDLLEIKLFITQSIQKIDDDLGALGSWYVSRAFDENKQSPIDAIEKINSISREKVIEVARKLSLDTIYTLSGKDEI